VRGIGDAPGHERGREGEIRIGIEIGKGGGTEMMIGGEAHGPKK
jgi:hypothetical protein